MIYFGVATAETQSIKMNASIEGTFEFGQKNISTLERNLLNADEIIRIPSSKLLVIVRGNKPLLLDKMIYTEHPLSKKLVDMPVSNYIPNWNNNIVYSNAKMNAKKKDTTKNDNMEKENYEEITFDNF